MYCFHPACSHYLPCPTHNLDVRSFVLFQLENEKNPLRRSDWARLLHALPVSKDYSHKQLLKIKVPRFIRECLSDQGVCVETHAITVRVLSRRHYTDVVTSQKQSWISWQPQK